MLNGLAGLATAYACSSPVLYIAGQVDSAALGRGLGALHEIPGQSEILRTLTKWSGLAQRPEQIPGLVHRAFAELRSGRPPPVLIDAPVGEFPTPWHLTREGVPRGPGLAVGQVSDAGTDPRPAG
jgi:acetolactate synthase-1/2/3 large subunit